ncbi:MAG: outer membrane protein transport protein [Planctomycetes bacterium]|nr:outer membrane protein transport protein [Planctomycetota bacterium]
MPRPLAHQTARRCRRLHFGLACCTLAGSGVLAPLLAVDLTAIPFGGSPVPIGAGARALGMGGAFTAVADDATANTWNPAGMAQLERPELAINGGYYGRSTAIQGGGAGSKENDLALDHVSAVLPFFLFGFQQSVGVAWQRQFDFTRRLDFSAAGTSGTTVINQSSSDNRNRQTGSWSNLSLSYGAEVAPGFSVGATFGVWADSVTGASSFRRHADGTLTQSSFTLGPPEALISDVQVTSALDQRVSVRSGYNIIVGTLWQATPALTLAATFKPRYRLDLDLTRDSSLVAVDRTSGAILQDDEVHDHRQAAFTYPSSATVGMAWRQHDRRTFTLDVTWTRWREMRTDDGGVITSPVNPFIAPGDVPDGFAVRTGFEQILFTDALTVVVPRCGLLFEELAGVTAAPDAGHPEQVSAKLDRWFGATAGLSIFRRAILFDFAGQVRYGHGVGASVDAPAEQVADVTTWTVRGGITYHF